MDESSITQFRSFIKNKKVAVLGIGISNTSLIKYLSKMEVDITAFDMAEEEQLKDIILQFKDYGNISYSLGKDYLKKLNGFDIIFKTPKIRFDIPELERERKRGAVITSEMEVFVDLCPAEIIAITGSDGKTTTTTIVHNILKEAGYKCWLGGNIGTPLIDRIEDIKKTDKVILELSSFQLHTMKKSPNIAIITNISPNHLDVHKSMDEYIDAKKNIFRYQSKEDILVLNYQNDVTRSFAAESKGKVRYFSRTNEVETGAYVRDGVIMYRDDRDAKGDRDNRSGRINREIMRTDSIKIPGLHNVENYLAAIAAIAHLVDNNSIIKTASAFRGVEHRNEHVREINGVNFYNDSIGSSPTRTIASINSFDRKVILIAGGYDKKISYDVLGKTISEKVKTLVLLGETAPLIENSLRKEVELSGKGKDIPVYKCNTLEEAVKKAYSCAESGDIIILSPASASFDMFKNFEERGNKFKEIVDSIIP
jgi:UDP-N-acetylmuramoylalanine--D-glutamate ligase